LPREGDRRTRKPLVRRNERRRLGTLSLRNEEEK